MSCTAVGRRNAGRNALVGLVREDFAQDGFVMPTQRQHPSAAYRWGGPLRGLGPNEARQSAARFARWGSRISRALPAPARSASFPITRTFSQSASTARQGSAASVPTALANRILRTGLPSKEHTARLGERDTPPLGTSEHTANISCPKLPPATEHVRLALLLAPPLRGYASAPHQPAPRLSAVSRLRHQILTKR